MRENNYQLYETSSAQKRLFLIHRMHGATTAYNMPVSVLLYGKPDAPALNHAFHRLIRRHETLRTSFEMEDGQVLQRVWTHMDFQLEYISSPQQEAHCLIDNFIRPFNPEILPLIRAQLVKLEEEKFLLTIDTHHIISDGVSSGIILEELMLHYNGRQLPPPEVQYVDFVMWQNDFLASGEIKTQENYWLNLYNPYNSTLPLLDMPTDAPRQKQTDFKGKRIGTRVPPGITERLKALLQDEKTTLFMGLIAIYGILLSRYTNQQDIIIGTPIAGRTDPQLQRTVGFFINTLALRTFPGYDKTFVQFLKEVKQHCLEAFENQDYQFETLVEKLDIRRTPGRNPLFDTMLVLQNTQLNRVEIKDLRIEPFKNNIKTAKFDILLEAGENDKHLDIYIEYSTALFKEARIKRFASHFRELIVSIIKNPRSTIQGLEIITTEEKHQVLTSFNDFNARNPDRKYLHRLFAEQAEKNPDRAAITGPGQDDAAALPLVPHSHTLTYRELNLRADTIAAVLRSKGANRETIVALKLDRTVEMIAAILGVIKAGAAYLPIDPGCPGERIDYMLMDSKSRFLVTARKFAKQPDDSPGLRQTPPGGGPRRLSGGQGEAPPGPPIRPDKALETIVLEDMGPRETKGDPGGQGAYLMQAPLTRETGDLPLLAYIIYTSGTTGGPKGVMVEHANVTGLIYSGGIKYRLDRNDVWTHFHSYCFDFSVWEMYGPLLTGARVSMVPRITAQEPRAFLELLEKQQVTILNQTPTAFYHLIGNELERPETGLNLKYIIFGGEPLAPRKLQQWRARYPRVTFVNMYGITETTVHSTYKVVGEKEINNNTGSVGFPLPTLTAYILDPGRQHVPVGVPGEIYVGGGGTGRGYLNRPQLTQERFIPDPYQPGKILYKSGDLARRMETGEIEYLGRIDRQIKIRGHRIELDEIAHQILKHPSVKESIVMAREDEQEEKYLCAYFVETRNGTTPVNEQNSLTPPGKENPGAILRDYLSGTLPYYMIPSHFIKIDNLPLTPNGKIDTKALPPPCRPRMTTSHPDTAPRNETEKRLSQIWNQLLYPGSGDSSPAIGIDGNFFQLGGHSLKAAVLSAEIHKHFNVVLPLPEIFNRQTIRQQARFIDEAAGEKWKRIQPGEEKEYYPLSSSQKRLFILQTFQDNGTAYNTVTLLNIEGGIDALRLEKGFRRLIRRHESLRTSFTTINGTPCQRVHPDAAFQLEQYTAAQDHPGISLTIRNFIRPFDLSRPPLLRAALIHIHHQEENSSQNNAVLAVDLHHIITDGASAGILVKDFTAPFNNRDLPPLKLRYRDFTSWQNSRLESGALKKQETHWVKAFEPGVPVLTLPYDFQRPAVQSFDGITVNFTIAKEEPRRLERLADRYNGTLYMVLLALFNIFLSKLSGSEDIIVGSPAASRTHADLQGLIGVFINTLPMRNYPGGDKPFHLFLEEVKKQVLEALENQDYQFEDLVDKISAARSARRNPLFDVMLVLQNMEIPELEIPGIKLTPYRYENETSQFDLTLTGEYREDTLEFTLSGCSKLFKKETLQRFAGYFKTLTTRVLRDPGREIGQIRVHTDEEERLLLNEFNNPYNGIPSHKTVHQLFEERALKKPGGAALEKHDLTLTYSLLNRDADRLSKRLRARGVTTDHIVAIKGGKTPATIAAMIGILKAGGAFLALKAGHPSRRNRYMLNESRAKLLVTGSTTAGLEIRSLSPPTAPAPGNCKPSCSASSSGLAYIIYTSGTTGNPKAAAVEHTSLVNLVVYGAAFYDLKEDEKTSLIAPITFDAAMEQIFLPLTSGSVLVLIDDDTLIDPPTLENYITRHALTHLNGVPSYLENIVFKTKNCLRRVAAGGEACPTALAARWNKIGDFFNLYGPAEATVNSTMLKYRDTGSKRGYIPLGTPVANTWIYILDKWLKPVPPGAAGEIYIGGNGLSRGYLNQPEMTSEKFIRSPFRDTHPDFPDKPYNRLLYKTGDLACRLPSGDLEFAGRIDQQVKINGQRVELMEIESRMLNHHRVKEAIVILVGETSPEKSLCAYIVEKKTGNNNDGEELSIPAFKEYLSDKLPAHMIPAFFVIIEKMPLTANGKVDRRALPPPDPDRPVPETHDPPSGHIQEALVEIWKQLLPVKTIGINDSFFDLGGNSLRLIRLSHLLEERFNIKINVVDLFILTTIKRLSDHIAGQASDPAAEDQENEAIEVFNL